MADLTSLITGAIFERLTQKNLFTVPEIVTLTGTSMTTVSKYVSSMLESGLVEPGGTVKTGGRGRQAILYGLKGARKQLLGVDVKNDMLVMRLTDLSGKVTRTVWDKSFRYANSDSNLEEVCMSIGKFLSESPAMEIVQACIILGGRVNSLEGTSASCYNVEELGETPLAEFLSERLGFPVLIENDTKAMAYGEYLSEEHSKYKDLLYINIGWGLGAGIIIDGRLYHGKDGYSGEFGHIHAYDNDILCHCGKKGCLETEVSGRAIHRKLLEQLDSGKSSILAPKHRMGEVIMMEDIMDAARKEDPLCIDLISKAGTELGARLASLINIFNPECILIGGSMSKAASYYFLHPISAAIRKYSLKLMSKDVVLEVSTLGEDAGVHGACMLAKKMYFEVLNKKVASGINFKL